MYMTSSAVYCAQRIITNYVEASRFDNLVKQFLSFMESELSEETSFVCLKYLSNRSESEATKVAYLKLVVCEEYIHEFNSGMKMGDTELWVTDSFT
jgi:hypothetical protein